MSDSTWVIQTADLKVGTILSVDLIDSKGRVLHAAGNPISQELKEFLERNQIESLTIKSLPESVASRAESLLSSSFEPGIVAELKESIHATQVAMSNAIGRLQSDREIDSDEVVKGVEYFVDTASKDLAAALASLTIHGNIPSKQDVDRLTSRSVRLSLLGIVTSLSQGQSSQFAIEVGLAGLLHDCSLINYPRLLAYNGADALESRDLLAYRRHPVESADLLDKASSLPHRVLDAVAQVHEQSDGSGFPRGLRLSETLSSAVILNTADAYLTLTDSSSNHRIVQSDAIAYLVNHATRGKFCPKTIQAMMRGMSIYPVGTIVQLDDQTTAVVVRSNSESPTKPVVRVLNSSQQRIDLLHSSRSISGPYVDGSTGFNRVRKTELNQIFWRLDAHRMAANTATA